MFPLMTEGKNRWRVHAGLSLMALLWGVVFVAIKLGGEEMPIQVYNANRFTLGVAVLGWLTWRAGRWQAIDAKTALELTALGLLGHGFMQMAMVSGIMRTTASASALIYGGTPLAVALLSALLGVERLSSRRWLGLALAAGGMAAVVLQRSPGGALPEATAAGNALMGLATLMVALYTVWSRRLLARLDVLFVTTWVLGVGGVLMLLWSLPYQTVALYEGLSLGGWAAILYGAFLALVAPNLLYLYGVRELGRAGTASYINAVPFIGCVAGCVVFGERLHPLQAMGAVLILTGIWLAQRPVEVLSNASTARQAKL